MSPGVPSTIFKEAEHRPPHPRRFRCTTTSFRSITPAAAPPTRASPRRRPAYGVAVRHAFRIPPWSRRVTTGSLNTYGRSPCATRPLHWRLPSLFSPSVTTRSPCATSTPSHDDSPSSDEPRPRALPGAARHLIAARHSLSGPGPNSVGAPRLVASPGHQVASAQPQRPSALHQLLASLRPMRIRTASGCVPTRCLHTIRTPATAQVPVAMDRSLSSARRCPSAIHVSRLRVRTGSLEPDGSTSCGRRCRMAAHDSRSLSERSSPARARSRSSWPAPHGHQGAPLWCARPPARQLTVSRRLSAGPCARRAARGLTGIPWSRSSVDSSAALTGRCSP